MLQFIPVYLSGFFLSLHYAAVVFVNSSFLGQFFSPEISSFLYVLGAIGNIVLLAYVSKLLNFFGAKKFFYVTLIIDIGAILALAFANTPIMAAISFIVFASVSLIIYYVLDVFLEEITNNDRTGEIRGTYLTTLNLAVALAPLLVAMFVVDSDFYPIYIISLFLLSPLLAVGLWFKKEVEDKPHHPPTELPWRRWWSNDSVRRITFARLVLESFFAFMVIYSPIYLHTILGFQWQSIGVMFTIMLIPFVIFQWPVGELADRFYGEKEFIIGGFIFMLTMLVLMPFLGKSIFVWTIILFVSRVGASIVEVSTESYFFKQIDATDTGTISIFRLVRPTSLAIAASIGAVILNFISFEKIFFVVAIIVALGLREVLPLKDTL